MRARPLGLEINARSKICVLATQFDGDRESIQGSIVVHEDPTSLPDLLQDLAKALASLTFDLSVQLVEFSWYRS